MQFILISFYILFGYFLKQFDCNINVSDNNNICAEITPQKSVDIEQIVGLWYSNEIIPHGRSKDGVFYFKTCVTIHISDITDSIPTPSPKAYYYQRKSDSNPTENRYLRLLWDEDGIHLKYTFRYNVTRPGYWMTFGPQEGSLLKTLHYQQFQGSVQVIKAINNQLVLTFCSHNVNGTLFSVILSRQSQSLSAEDIVGIRKLIQRRGLSTTDIRKVCTSGSASILKNRTVSIFILLSYMFMKFF